MSTRLAIAEDGTIWAVDPDESHPEARLIQVTGYWCPVCRLPRDPYLGDHGMHPLCAERVHPKGGEPQ